MLLDGTCRSLQASLNTLEVYGTMSGLKMNKEKTKIVWLGRKKHSKEKLKVNIKLNWGTTEFILLGLNFSVDIEKMIFLWDQTSKEDSQLCEMNQKGIESQAYQPGRYGDLEISLVHYQKFYLDHLQNYIKGLV